MEMKGEKTIAERFGWLPVAAVAEDVNASLRRTPRLVVTAPPGAGKSTLLPLSILEGMQAQASETGKGLNRAARQSDLGVDGKILMLEPRRLAARQVAIRMAVGHARRRRSLPTLGRSTYPQRGETLRR